MIFKINLRDKILKPSPEIRQLTKKDIEACISLFREAVHAINAKDYSKQQLDIWAPSYIKLEEWTERLLNNISYVAEHDGKIVGFASMTKLGYFDLLYIEKNFPKGIAMRLAITLGKEARRLNIKKITMEVSITAKPFCEKLGCHVVRQQIRELHGEQFIVYAMEREI